MVDLLARTAIRAAAAETLGLGPEDTGSDRLWAICWRTRSADWILRHRDLLARAFAAGA
jgi:hypothetical protein